MESPVKGKLVIDGEYDCPITKKDLKVLKGLMVTIETEVCKSIITNVRQAQENDPRLKTLYKMLGYD